MSAYDLLKSLASALGLAGLGVGVFFLLYRQLLRHTAFQRLKSGQAFALLSTIAILTFTVVMVSIYFAVRAPIALDSEIPVGDYRCTVDKEIFRECRILQQAGREMLISFLGPNHGRNQLIDRYQGRLVRGADGVKAEVINEYAFDPASDSVPRERVSDLVLLSNSKTRLLWRWKFRDGTTYDLEMVVSEAGR